MRDKNINKYKQAEFIQHLPSNPDICLMKGNKTQCFIQPVKKKDLQINLLEQKFGLISIIMATFNAENTIEQAIKSVLSQTYTNWELLIVNDCSSDGTEDIVRKIIKSDKRIRLINNESNSGVSYTRQNGLQNCKGKWIAILDSDDAWASNKLEKQIVLQQEKKADLIFTGSNFMDENGNLIDWYLHVPTEICYRQLLKQNLISNSSVLVRKELYEKYYAIGDNMHEDFAIWLGAMKSGRIAYGIDKPLLVYRINKLSKSGNKMVAAKMNWNTYRYMGLNAIEAIYYECWYMVKGFMKYRNLKREGKKSYE